MTPPPPPRSHANGDPRAREEPTTGPCLHKAKAALLRLAGMAVDEGERAREKLSKDRRPKNDHFGMFPCTKKNINFTKIAHNFQDHQKTVTSGPIRPTFQVVKGSPSEIAESIMQSSGGWAIAKRVCYPQMSPKGKSISGTTYPKPPYKKAIVLRCIFIPPFPLP